MTTDWVGIIGAILLALGAGRFVWEHGYRAGQRNAYRTMQRGTVPGDNLWR